jgi:hypothetical protein
MIVGLGLLHGAVGDVAPFFLGRFDQLGILGEGCGGQAQERRGIMVVAGSSLSPLMRFPRRHEGTKFEISKPSSFVPSW